MKRRILLSTLLCGLSVSCAQPQTQEAPIPEPDEPQVITRLGHSREITAVAISPDGQFVLSGDDRGVTKLWEFSSGKEIRTFFMNSNQIMTSTLVTPAVMTLSFSPDGTYGLISSALGLKRYDLKTGKEANDYNLLEQKRMEASPKDEKRHIARGPAIFSTDGKQIFSEGSLDLVFQWQADSGKLLHQYENADNGNMRNDVIAVSANGRYAALGSGDSPFKVWDTGSGELTRSIDLKGVPVKQALFSPDNKQLLLAAEDKTVRLIELTTGREIRRFAGHKSQVKGIALSADGQTLLTTDTQVHFWQLSTGKPVRQVVISPADFDVMTFSPDKKFLLTASKDRSLRLFDLTNGKLVRQLKGEQSQIGVVAFSADRKRVLTGPAESNQNLGLKLWDVSEGKLVRSFSPPQQMVTALAFSDDQKLALTGSEQGDLTLWNVETGKPSQTWVKQTGPVTALAFSHQGNQALTGQTQVQGENRKSDLARWDIATGKVIQRYPGCERDFDKVIFTPDDNRILSLCISEAGKMLDLSGKVLWSNALAKTAPAFSTDQQSLLVSSLSNLVMLNPVDGKELFQSPIATDIITSTAFSPDKKQALSGSSDMQLKLWDLGAEGKYIRTLHGHQATVLDAVYMPDGKTILSAGKDGTIRIWNSGTGHEIGQIAIFTDGEWVALLPQGYFNLSSDKALRHLLIRSGMKVRGIEAYQKQFFRPDLVKQAFSGQPVPPAPRVTLDGP